MDDIILAGTVENLVETSEHHPYHILAHHNEFSEKVASVLGVEVSEVKQNLVDYRDRYNDHTTLGSLLDDVKNPDEYCRVEVAFSKIKDKFGLKIWEGEYRGDRKPDLMVSLEDTKVVNQEF